MHNTNIMRGGCNQFEVTLFYADLIRKFKAVKRLVNFLFVLRNVQPWTKIIHNSIPASI